VAKIIEEKEAKKDMRAEEKKAKLVRRLFCMIIHLLKVLLSGRN
jgi:hypothetical protein